MSGVFIDFIFFNISHIKSIFLHKLCASVAWWHHLIFPLNYTISHFHRTKQATMKMRFTHYQLFSLPLQRVACFCRTLIHT